MQWSLFLLVLMGHCPFSTCHFYEYHFIEENKTWDEAQLYCREKYTDLATVYNMTDMKRLHNSSAAQAWIGLYNNTTGEKEWHWSLPGVEYNDTHTLWNKDEPNDKTGHENCVSMDTARKLFDIVCDREYSFICYNESSSVKYHLIEEKKNWTQAQSYCREHHTDLVSGERQLQDNELKEETNKSQMKAMNNNQNLWIGLFRDTWTWSDGSNFPFRHWDQGPFGDGQGQKNCTFLKTSGKWGSDRCHERKPFFCYEDKLILIQQNMTWVEAFYHCREKYCDLVSITDVHQQRWVQQRAKNASSPFVWLGMRYTCTLDFWFWVSDETADYLNWESEEKTDDCDFSGAMETGGHYKWIKKMDSEKFNFICSDF
ncbi:macrophage mannose receptor 1-like [Seriola dumerili]|uniref:Macrophage mannose receptor 1-like n=1 Tax=Seriola dumerili TaxID=41447 RepID=A0A3B4T7M9_SERDU|nr:macrophage mannose receptor 1-like [Seriola dumerili]XP_022625634.1 macrophage mannose receptor 1-like [Seriola dumerili]